MSTKKASWTTWAQEDNWSGLEKVTTTGERGNKTSYIGSFSEALLSTEQKMLGFKAC